MKKSEKLYTIEKDVICSKCGNKGVIQYYGEYYPYGKELKSKVLNNENDKIPYLSHAIGFGGTIPYECMNCGSIGLIDYDGLEGYSKTFERIKKDKV